MQHWLGNLCAGLIQHTRKAAQRQIGGYSHLLLRLLLAAQHSTDSAACVTPETGGLYCASLQLWTACFAASSKIDADQISTSVSTFSRPLNITGITFMDQWC